MFVRRHIKYIYFAVAFIFILSLVFFDSGKGWGSEEKEIEIIKRPLLENDMPAIRVVPSHKKHDHAKHKKKVLLMLPAPGTKVLIGNRKGNPEKGKPIYKKYCNYCHGPKGLGDGMTAIALEPSPANFTREGGFMDRTPQENFDFITYGIKSSYHLDMPAWGPVLSVDEILDVIAYIRDMVKKELADKEVKDSHGNGHEEDHHHHEE